MLRPRQTSPLDSASDLVVQSFSNVAERLNLDKESRAMRSSFVLETRRGIAAKERLERKRERLLLRWDALRNRLRRLLEVAETPLEPSGRS